MKSHLSTDEDSYKCIDLKQCCTDILEGNFLCEGNFQDERYRFDLQLMESCHSATFLGILYDQAALDKFACLLKHAIKSVSVQMSQKKWMAKTDSEKMSQTDDGLSEDTELLISMLGSVAKHVDEPDDNEGEIFCYSTSMFLCSLAEKLLRLLYIHLLLLKGEDVPSDIRLGMLLSADNDKMTKVFGSVHIQLLACFLIGMPGIKSGPSYRNSLAHWSSGMSPDKMTPKLVSSLLWLFTDILNSIVLYFNSHAYCGVHGDAGDEN